MLVSVEMGDRDPGIERACDLTAQLPLDVGEVDPTGRESHQESTMVGKRLATGRERADLGGRRDQRRAGEREVQADLESRARAKLPGRAFEVWSAGNDAAGRHDPIVVGGERTVGHPRVETDVVGGDDQQRIHQEGATVGSTAGGVRRLGRRMSPPSATSSLRMVTTTPGDDSVEPPRERGK